MLVQDLIRKKRDGAALSESEIQFLAAGIADGSLSEGQVASFAMAVFFRGMGGAECATLTRAMRDSGDVIEWASLNLPGPVVDKHSTGGVGDKVSIMLAPMLAACGAYVPMISGRGLGHTGGTLDKLDSIPGYESQPDIARLRTVVRDVGCAIVGQTRELAPADKRFYAIRDVTGTVESIPLITASILSKKLSAGLDALVMDIKCGSGAFADNPVMAGELAQSILAVGEELGLPTTALITDMTQVLGRSAGNSLEILESLNYLRGDNVDPRLHTVVTELGAALLRLAGLVETEEEGRTRLQKGLESGAALEILGRMITALGGPADFVDKPENYMPPAQVIVPVYPESAGIVNRIDVRAVGNAVVELGGGRRLVTDELDFRVGFDNVAEPGQSVDRETPLAILHAASEVAAVRASEQLRAAFSLADQGSAAEVILERVTAFPD